MSGMQKSYKILLIGRNKLSSESFEIMELQLMKFQNSHDS